MDVTRRKLLAYLSASAAMPLVATGASAQTTADGAKPALDPLPDWSKVKLQLWKYNNPFVPSQWSEPKLGGYDWKAANVKIEIGRAHV